MRPCARAVRHHIEHFLNGNPKHGADTGIDANDSLSFFFFARVILENATVRAAAVPALAKFAARLPSLRASIRVLLKRSLLDDDDEVTNGGMGSYLPFLAQFFHARFISKPLK